MILSFPLRPVQVGSDGIVDGTANDESIAPQTMVGTCTTLSLRTYASRLRERLGPVVHLCITDCSDGHTRAGYLDGRALDPNGMELKVLIVSRAFVDMPPLERQRIVNGLLEVDIVVGKIHSLQLRCWTPEQWENKGRPQTFGNLPGKPPMPCSLTASPVSIVDAPMMPSGTDLPFWLPLSAIDEQPSQNKRKTTCGGDPRFCDGSCKDEAVPF